MQSGEERITAVIIVLERSPKRERMGEPQRERAADGRTEMEEKDEPPTAAANY